jgi:hypothetical protein
MLNREVGFVLSNGHRQSSPAGPKSATSGRPKNYHFEISSFRALRSAAAVLAIGDLTFETVPNERNLRNRKKTSN